MSIVFGIILSVIYLYFVFQIGSIQKGIIKNIVGFGLITLCMVTGEVFKFQYLGALVATVILLLFDLFYDDESFFQQWKWIVLFGGIVSGLFLFYRLLGQGYEITLIIFIILVTYILLTWYRKLIKEKTNVLMVLLYGCYMYLSYSFKESHYSYVILLISIISFATFETMLSGYKTTFKKKTAEFQQDLLANQYEEIKTVYLNMRGFRHDYHNHIQAIKAKLYMNQIDLLNKYLLELEGELERIDSTIRSGNLMLDAILNSKVAVADKYNIKVICKAEVPEKLPVTDIDLCVILGNLLDNAIESCQKVEKEPFIRIYVAIIKQQLYISIQNSAKEDLSFNEKNYITTKRGNHGLGMKRVKLLVDKYDGYLNLQNEPGIFASEVTFKI